MCQIHNGAGGYSGSLDPTQISLIEGTTGNTAITGRNNITCPTTSLLGGGLWLRGSSCPLADRTATRVIPEQLEQKPNRKIMKLTTISKALPLIAVAVWMAGCRDTSVAAVQKPVNQADPTGDGLNQERSDKEMINGDPSMTPDQKSGDRPGASSNG